MAAMPSIIAPSRKAGCTESQRTWGLSRAPYSATDLVSRRTPEWVQTPWQPCPRANKPLVYLRICLRQMALAHSKISSSLPSTVAFKIPSKRMHANLMQFAIGCGFFALAQGSPLCDGFHGLLSQQRGDPMKKVVVLVVALVAALNVAGCAGKGKTPVAPPPPPPITK